MIKWIEKNINKKKTPCLQKIYKIDILDKSKNITDINVKKKDLIINNKGAGGRSGIVLKLAEQIIVETPQGGAGNGAVRQVINTVFLGLAQSVAEIQPPAKREDRSALAYIPVSKGMGSHSDTVGVTVERIQYGAL